MFGIAQNKKEMVQLLEHLLEETKSNSLTSFVITAKYKNNKTCHHMGGPDAIKAWNDVAAILKETA